MRLITFAVVTCAILLALSLDGQAAQSAAVDAPSAVIPERTAPVQAAPPAGIQQTVRRTTATLDEEIEAAAARFSDAYTRAKAPRLLVLFNRDMEDNDRRNMVKTGKVQGGVATESKAKSNDAETSNLMVTPGMVVGGSSKGQENRSKTEGGSATYQRVDPGPDAYSEQEADTLRQAFESVLLQAGARLVDRDTAIRMHGLKEEAVFSYGDLPETQRSQVAGVKEYAEIVISVELKRGAFEMQRSAVAGTSDTVMLPNLIAKATRLSDAQTLASAMTEDLKSPSRITLTPQRTPLTETAKRVAVVLMDRLANTLAASTPPAKAK